MKISASSWIKDNITAKKNDLMIVWTCIFFHLPPSYCLCFSHSSCTIFNRSSDCSGCKKSEGMNEENAFPKKYISSLHLESDCAVAAAATPTDYSSRLQCEKIFQRGSRSKRFSDTPFLPLPQSMLSFFTFFHPLDNGNSAVERIIRVVQFLESFI